jgi:phosphate-selective porin
MGLVVAALAVSAGKAAAQNEPRRGFAWHDRPAIVFGEDVYVDFRVKANLDWRVFDPELDGEDLFELDAGRLGLKGEITRHLDFEIERDLILEPETNTGRWGDWKDVYLNWDTFDPFSVRGGRFKLPFGLEQNIGRTDLDFAYRARASQQLAPARDKGVMVYGRFFGRGLTYEAGWFHTDGDIGKLSEPQFAPEGEVRQGPTYAGRVTAAVLRPMVGEDAELESLRLGGAYTIGRIPEGLNSLRGETPYGYDYFLPVYVKGYRQRVGVELDWTPGPFGIRAEWMQSREDREEQGLGDVDLPDVLGTGWYVSGTWIVTGESKDDNINPRHPVYEGGAGAIELGVRYDQLGFSSASQEGPALPGPRAPHILGNTDRAWTAGVNWYPMRHVRLIGNAIHEDFEDPARTPMPGQTGFWSGIFRLQLVF